MDDEAIQKLVTRLARAHPSGGTVIERAAIVAEGTGSDLVLDWILAHGAEAEVAVVKTARRGLHESEPVASSTPARYILPAGALG
jgi:hypothetical protein